MSDAMILSCCGCAQIAGFEIAVASSQATADRGLLQLKTRSTDNTFGLHLHFDKGPNGEKRLSIVVLSSSSPYRSGTAEFDAHNGAPFALVIQLAGMGYIPPYYFLRCLASASHSFVTNDWAVGGPASPRSILQGFCTQASVTGLDFPAERFYALCQETGASLSEWAGAVFGPTWKQLDPIHDTLWMVGLAAFMNVL